MSMVSVLFALFFLLCLISLESGNRFLPPHFYARHRCSYSSILYHVGFFFQVPLENGCARTSVPPIETRPRLVGGRLFEKA